MFENHNANMRMIKASLLVHSCTQGRLKIWVQETEASPGREELGKSVLHSGRKDGSCKLNLTDAKRELPPLEARTSWEF